MKSRFLKLLFVLVFTAACVLPSGVLTTNVHAATTYYMSTTGNDNNNGLSTGSAWRTLAYAASQLAAGDTLYIRGGTYNVSSALQWPVSGTSSAPITVAAYQDEEPIFDGGGGEFDTILFTGKSWVTIDGLTIRNSMGPAGIWIGRNTGASDPHSTHITIKNCTFLNLGNALNNDHGVYISWGADYITVNNCLFKGVIGAGVHFWHAPGGSYYYIYNNVFFGGKWGVINTDAHNYVYIYNNTFYNNLRSIQYNPADGEQNSTNMVVKNNIFYNTTGQNALIVGAGSENLVTEDYNCYYNTDSSSKPIQWGSLLYTVAELRNNTGNADHSIQDNPDFTSLTPGSENFHLQSVSPAKNSGVTLADVTVDFDYTSRPQGSAYDMGAYEVIQATPTPTPTPTLPSEWSSGDIGSCSPAGSSGYSSGTFTIAGAGADVWGTADAFQFCKTSKSGDCTVIARVASQTNTHAGAKAGCMIRETLNTNSANAFVTVTPSSGVTFQLRTSAGGTTSTTSVAGITAPIWLKLVRSGNNFSGYYSSNGTSWTQIGTTQSITMTSSVYSGLAVTSHVNGTLSTATFDNVQNIGLPSGWSSGDIGSCTPAGSSSYDAGTFTISGSGADVWGTADAFQFSKTSKSGDCTVIARVASQTNTHAGAKAGCMIRETLNANSANAFVTVTPSSGVTFQVRTSSGGTTTTTVVAGVTAPIWLKLVRSGNNFSGYYSSNGTSWTQIGTTQSITMTSSVYSGLAVTSHVNGTLCTATFTDVSN